MGVVVVVVDDGAGETAEEAAGVCEVVEGEAVITETAAGLLLPRDRVAGMALLPLMTEQAFGWTAPLTVAEQIDVGLTVLLT